MTRLGRGRPRLLEMLALAIVLAGGLIAAPSTAVDVSAAAPSLTLTTDATYTVQPDKARVHVTLDAVAVSHTRDTLTKRFYFSSSYLTVLPGTANFGASNGSASLGVHVAKRTADYVLLSVDFDRRVYSGQSYRFRLQFDLPDPGGLATRDVRIGSTIVAFPVWAFASTDTAGSTVRVILPAGFEPESGSGDLPAPSPGSGGTLVYQTGRLAAPLDFYAYVTADRPGAFRETAVSADVAGRQAAVVVRSWADDPAWGKQVADVFRRGLPALGALIGLPYPRSGELTVEEAVSRTLGGYSGLFDPVQGRIQVAYYAEPFVILHEAAHTWFNSDLATDRWIDEAFASWYAERAAGSLGIKVTGSSLTPAMLRSRIQLNEWGAVGQADSAVEDYAYAATLTLAGLIAQRAGPGALSTVWKAAADREAAYQPVHASAAPVRTPAASAPDWRGLLDLLEQRTGKSFGDLWRAWVVRVADRPLLDQRDAARADYAATVARAGDWELPPDIRDALGAWHFPEAREMLADARSGLDLRDQVASRARASGLSVPATLRRLFESAGGLRAALVEGRNELSAISAVEAARAAAESHSRSGIAGDVGLVGRDPRASLAAARAAFARGDLLTAVSDAGIARDTWNGASAVGEARLAVGVGASVVVALLLAASLLLMRRQRRRRRLEQAAVDGAVVETAASDAGGWAGLAAADGAHGGGAAGAPGSRDPTEAPGRAADAVADPSAGGAGPVGDPDNKAE